MRFRIKCVWAFLYLCFAVTSVFGQAPDKISVRADLWIPVNGVPESENEGYFIDLLRAIGKRQGFLVDYSLSSWEVAVADATAGRIDCVVGAAIGDAPQLAFPKKPWMALSTGLYAHADHPLAEIESLTVDDFVTGNWILGMLAGYAYAEEVEALAEKLPSERVLRVGEATRFPLQFLVHRAVVGKVDAFVESDKVLNAYLESIELTDRIVKIMDIGEPLEVYVACHGRALIEVIEAGYEQLELSGELLDLQRQYGLAP